MIARGVVKISQHSSRGKDWQLIRKRVLDRDGWVCQVEGCGAELEEGINATVDHIIPKGKGGTDDELNLMAMCKPHNDSKQDKVLERPLYLSPRWFPNGWPVGTR